MLTQQQLSEKWSPVLDHADLPSITEAHKRATTAVLLENTERALREERASLMETGAPSSFVGDGMTGTGTTGVGKGYDPVLIGLVRRAMPQLIAYDICGVQPMTAPSGLVFALKSQYVDNATPASRTEALFNEANSGWSGDAAKSNDKSNSALPAAGGLSPVESANGLSPWDSTPGFANNGGMTTTYAESVTPQEMSFYIDKFTVTAKSRALKAAYSVELAQDLKAVHGLDAEGELSNILSNEILAEINREVIRTVYKIAKQGAELTTTAGTFDLDTDANGRWSVERFKGLMFQIEREANRVAQTTRRGRANFILCSADVASALSMAGTLDTGAALGGGALKVDDSSATFCGVLNGKYKVYIDPYMSNGTTDQFCVVGYRGTSAFDAGLFYCPYVPLQLMRAVDPDTFQPKIGFKSRYGLVSHPLSGDAATLGAQSNFYFRIFRVSNIA
jgi:hypothetical protein